MLSDGACGPPVLGCLLHRRGGQPWNSALADCTVHPWLEARSRAGKVTRLRRKACPVLTYLLARHVRVVPRDELWAQVCPRQCISEWTLESTIGAVRQAIGDS